MKKILLYFFFLYSVFSLGQTYPSQNINLLSLIDPNTNSLTIGPDGRKYAGCWGWHQTSTNKEYAIACGSNGTYFIDVSIPSTPSVCAFVPGRGSATNREAKTYQNYCYVVCDEVSPNTFQIIDMSTLPATVTLVHDDKTYFERAHTIFIEQDKMYIGLATYSTGILSPMNVYSLATPTAPVLLREIKQDIPLINTVHDMFVRTDTVFASCGYQGLYVLKLNATNTFSQIGSYTGYAGSGAFNHSSMLTQDGKYLIFCDETPGFPIRFIDIQNLNNIQPIQTWQPFPNAIAHNPYLIGNKWAIVSCYQDGLYIYDISQPGNVWQSGYFDTYPQGGGNIGVGGNYLSAPYRGNWGAYPYLPSGIIIATDMQSGVFIFDPTNAYNNPVGIKTNSTKNTQLTIFPNPATTAISVNLSGLITAKLSIQNILGEIVFEKQINSNISETVDVSSFSNGTYLLTVSEKEQQLHKKLIIQH